MNKIKLKQLKQLRLERELTQKRVAFLIGVTSQHLGQVERGKANLSAQMARKLAALYRVGLKKIRAAWEQA